MSSFPSKQSRMGLHSTSNQPSSMRFGIFLPTLARGRTSGEPGGVSGVVDVVASGVLTDSEHSSVVSPAGEGSETPNSRTRNQPSSRASASAGGHSPSSKSLEGVHFSSFEVTIIE